MIFLLPCKNVKKKKIIDSLRFGYHFIQYQKRLVTQEPFQSRKLAPEEIFEALIVPD